MRLTHIPADLRAESADHLRVKLSAERVILCGLQPAERVDRLTGSWTGDLMNAAMLTRPRVRVFAVLVGAAAASLPRLLRTTAGAHELHSGDLDEIG